MKTQSGQSIVSKSLLEMSFKIDKCVYSILNLGILARLLRMVMESKYYAEEVIGHPNHHLRI